jgi:prepilin-type N-terminal cleavage/methylation domain-containing protein
MSKRQNGFTLIEIAIVLVIIGLLLGGVLKGQELITGARVRNLIQQQDGVKAAYFGFLDRYRALPGDFSGAKAAINGVTNDGDGDGKIESTGAEHILVWHHLAKSGFINGSYTYGAVANDESNPKNPYGGFLTLIFDKVYGDGAQSERHNLKTGPNVPVEIVAEIDRKTDDGLPYTGSFQFSNSTTTTTGTGQSAVTTTTSETSCLDTPTSGTAPTTWNAGKGTSNCGGATLY